MRFADRIRSSPSSPCRPRGPRRRRASRRSRRRPSRAREHGVRRVLARSPAAEQRDRMRRLARAVDLREDRAERLDRPAEERGADRRAAEGDLLERRDRPQPRRPASRRRWIIVGTRNVCVPPSCSTAATRRSGVNFGKITFAPPAARNEMSFEPLPCVSGPACTITDGAERQLRREHVQRRAARPPCVCVAPFGRPVVPLV